MNKRDKHPITPTKAIRPAARDESLADPAARVCGGIVDGVWYYFVTALFGVFVRGVLLPLAPSGSPTAQFITTYAEILAILAVPLVVLLVIPTATGQQTAGQRRIGMHTVCYPSGDPVGFWCAGAHVAIAVLMIPITFLLGVYALWRDPRAVRKRLWHDRLLGVAVVWDPRRFRQMAQRCQECGYDLTGLPEPRCPECGTPFERFES